MMSLLLQRAKREYRQQHQYSINRLRYVQDTTVAHTLSTGVSSVKPNKVGWEKLFPWPKKSQSVVQEPLIDSVDVTTAFLVHQLGMAAAKDVAVDVQDSSNSEEVGASQASETATFPQIDEEEPDWLGLEDPPASDAPDALGSIRFLFAEPSKIVTVSRQECIRDSMDSNDFTSISRSASSISNVATAASTPPSVHSKRRSMCEMSVDGPSFRVYPDRWNGFMTSDVDIPIVMEQDQASNTQISTDGPKEDQARELANAHEVPGTSNSDPNVERAIYPPPKHAAEPLAAIATNRAESTHVGITLDAKEIEAPSNIQISESRTSNAGRWRRKTTKLATNGNDKAVYHLQGIITRLKHTHTAEKQKVQQELTKLEEANTLLERRNTNLGNTNFQYHQAYSLLCDRFGELEDRNLNEDPLTIAELNNVIKKLQERHSQLEESKMQTVMNVVREYDDYKQGQQGKVDALQAKLDRTQEELAYAIEARDAFEQQLSDALAVQNPTAQQIVSAFEAKEKTLKRENENMARILQEGANKRKKLEELATDLRLSHRRTERNLEEAQEQINQLESSNKLLEARAEPFDFLGLPPQQRNEIAQMQQVVADLTKELQSSKELLDKISRAKLGQTKSIILEDRDHHYQMYIARIEEQNDRIADLTNKLSTLEHAMHCDQGLAFGVQEENEELKISLNAVTKDLKDFREKHANGDQALVDPRSWQHMKECSEGREQAVIRQHKAEEKLQELQAEFDVHKAESLTVVANLWGRIWCFEGLLHPSQCPYYLTDDRGTLVDCTVDTFQFDVNWKDQNDELQLEADDLQKFGHYRGPKGTPDTWLPVALTLAQSQSQSQASGSNNFQASTNSSVSGSVAVSSITNSADRSNDAQASANSFIMGCVVGDSINTVAEAIAALDAYSSQHAAGLKWQNAAEVQNFIASQDWRIGKLRIHVVFLWARIWEFEAIVAPEECDPRVWNDRKALVRRAWKYAGFDPNNVDPQNEAGVPEPHGPLHTPDAWMPDKNDLEGDAENDSVDGSDGDSQDGHNDEDDNDDEDSDDSNGADGGSYHEVALDGSSALDHFSADVPDQPSAGTTSQPSSNGPRTQDHPTQDQTTNDNTNHSPPILISDSSTPTIPSSSTATPAELAARELLLTSDTQILNDHRLAQHLAANPYLLNLPNFSNVLEKYEPDPVLAEVKEPWVSRQSYKELDSSKKKNKGLELDLDTRTQVDGAFVLEEECAELEQEPYVPKLGLSQQQLDSAIADCQCRMNQSMGHEGVSQQTRTESGDAGMAPGENNDQNV